MRRSIWLMGFFSLLAAFGVLLISVSPASARPAAQQPTVSIPTVTGTPAGTIVRVNLDQLEINVRSGPGTEYDIVGVVVAGEELPAYGKSTAGLWIQVYYPGVTTGVAWVYSPLVTVIQGGDLAIMEPPPTSTPRVTPTVDATLAAEFVVEVPATRLPTFTPPAEPLSVPTFAPDQPLVSNATFPMGLIIIVFGLFGVIGAVISFTRGR